MQFIPISDESNLSPYFVILGYFPSLKAAIRKSGCGSCCPGPDLPGWVPGHCHASLLSRLQSRSWKDRERVAGLNESQSLEVMMGFGNCPSQCTWSPRIGSVPRGPPARECQRGQIHKASYKTRWRFYLEKSYFVSHLL